MASTLCDQGVFFDHESELLEDIFDWFNEHLPCPPFRAKLRSGEWTPNAVSWFRDQAGEPLAHLGYRRYPQGTWNDRPVGQNRQAG